MYCDKVISWISKDSNSSASNLDFSFNALDISLFISSVKCCEVHVRSGTISERVKSYIYVTTFQLRVM